MIRSAGVLLILLIFQLQLFAQLDAKSINFGLIKYTISDENLPPQSLEKILNAFASIGDKDVMLQESILNLLTDEGPTMDFDQIENWWNDFTPEDSVRLSKLLPLGMNYRERPLFMVWMTYFGHAYQKNVTFIEGHIDLQKFKDERYIHLPDPTDIYEGIMDLIYSHYSYSKWYLTYPEELEFFHQQLKQQAMTAYGSDTDEDILKWVGHVREEIMDSNTIYRDYLPAPMTPMVNHIRSMMRAAANAPQKQDVYEALDPRDYEPALNRLYKIIYGVPLPDGLVDEIFNYMNENRIDDPGIIIVALILSRYE